MQELARRTRARRLLGALGYASALFLILLSTAFGNFKSTWVFWPAGALVTQQTIFWARDRFFPKIHTEQVGSNAEATGPAPWIRRPWTVALVCFVLLALPLFALLPLTAFQFPFAATLAGSIGTWGVLVSTVGLVVAQNPEPNANRMSEWWLPSAAVFMLAFAAVNLVPGLVMLVVTGRDTGAPELVPLLLLPIAALVWRAIRARGS